MMDSTPNDDWDDADRELDARRGGARRVLRLGRRAKGSRARCSGCDATRGRASTSGPRRASSQRLAGVHRRLARRAPARTRNGHEFAPLLESADGSTFSPSDAIVIDGPPAWLTTHRTAFLLDGAFDARKVIDAARSVNGALLDGVTPSPRTILRVAPFLSGGERAALGIRDAADATAELALSWTSGALVASITLIDRDSGVRAPFSSLGATAPLGDGFVRFTPEQAEKLRTRLLAAGFVPRGGDAFALHGVERAAEFVRETLPQWTISTPGSTIRCPRSRPAIRQIDVSVSARRAEGAAARLVRAARRRVRRRERQPLTPQGARERCSHASGQLAEVRGKLFDVEQLRVAPTCSPTRRPPHAPASPRSSRCATNCTRASARCLAGEVEALRERLRTFEGIEAVPPPALLDGTLRGYQRARPRLSLVSRVVFVRRHPGRRHGPRQDPADDRAPLRARRAKARRRRSSLRPRR